MATLVTCLAHIQSCDTSATYECGLFLTTNESNQRETLEKLSRQQVVGNTAIGVSGFFILNAVTALGSKTASGGKIRNIIVIDCSKRVKCFWEHMKAILSRASDRFEARHMIIHDLAECQFSYWPETLCPELRSESAIQQLSKEIEDGTSFLSSDEKFAMVHQIAICGNLEFKLVNLFEFKTFEQMKSALDANGRTIALMYTSNVSEFATKTVHSQNPAADYGCNEVDETKALGFLTSTSLLVAQETLLIHTCSTPQGEFQKIMRRTKTTDRPSATDQSILMIARETFSWQYTEAHGVK